MNAVLPGPKEKVIVIVVIDDSDAAILELILYIKRNALKH